MEKPRQQEWEEFLASPETVRRGDGWFSRATPPGVPAPPKRTRLEQAIDWFEGQGVAVEVSSVGDEYDVDLVGRTNGRRFTSFGTGSSPGEAAESAIKQWKRKFPVVRD